MQYHLPKIIVKLDGFAEEKNYQESQSLCVKPVNSPTGFAVS